MRYCINAQDRKYRKERSENDTKPEKKKFVHERKHGQKKRTKRANPR